MMFYTFSHKKTLAAARACACTSVNIHLYKRRLLQPQVFNYNN